MRILTLRLVSAAILIVFTFGAISAQSTAFSYQGSLNDGANPANGNYDFEFRLFDTASGGAQISITNFTPSVLVTDGLFSVFIDFGNQFPGAQRFLEIRVRSAGVGSFTVLAPRQFIANSPYSLRSQTAGIADNAATATNALQLGGVAAGQFVQSNDVRLTDARNPLPNSTNYIQNRTTQQTASNFNVSGNGTAGGTLSGNVVNATTQINLNGSRLIAVPSLENTLVGINAGSSITISSGNSFFGNSAGQSNTTGSSNSFFGRGAGQNSNGPGNSFFGSNAGKANTTGGDNSFFGSGAGDLNTTANFNSFFGTAAGGANTSGASNSFFGRQAGLQNTTASNNSFFGAEAGKANSTATNNSFFGAEAGKVNTTGINNSFFGYLSGSANTVGTGNAFYGVSSGALNVDGIDNTIVGVNTGANNTSGSGNTFVGRRVGNANTTGSDNTAIGNGATFFFSGLNFATAIGAGAKAFSSNQITLGRTEDSVYIPSGVIRLGSITSGGEHSACFSFDGGTAVIIKACGSSIRYKDNVKNFSSGLETLKRLRPVTFRWKTGGMLDFGLIAEEVAIIEPLLATHNTDGEVDGVKYDRVGVVLINAVKEQQSQIESQNQIIRQQSETFEQLQNRLEKQQKEIESLKLLVCFLKPDAETCRPVNM